MRPTNYTCPYKTKFVLGEIFFLGGLVTVASILRLTFSWIFLNNGIYSDDITCKLILHSSTQQTLSLSIPRERGKEPNKTEERRHLTVSQISKPHR